MDHWDFNSLQAENVQPQSFNNEFYGTEHVRAYNETNFLSMETLYRIWNGKFDL